MTRPFCSQRLADGVQRFVDGGVDEAAGVDHDDIRGVVGGRDCIPLRAQLGEDALGIHQRLGAAEADEADFGGSQGHGIGEAARKKGRHPSRVNPKPPLGALHGPRPRKLTPLPLARCRRPARRRRLLRRVPSVAPGCSSAPALRSARKISSATSGISSHGHSGCRRRLLVREVLLEPVQTWAARLRRAPGSGNRTTLAKPATPDA